jgi:hypothetical protein
MGWDSKVVLFLRVMVTWDTDASVEMLARMVPPWGTLGVFTAIWMAGPGGRVVATVGATVVVGGRVVGAVVFATVVTIVVGTTVSLPVDGGPVVAAVVTTVVAVGAGVVSVVAGGAVVTGAGVVSAGGRVTMTMVGVEGAGVLSFRR